jgi:hypothetical protein
MCPKLLKKGKAFNKCALGLKGTSGDSVDESYVTTIYSLN